MTRSIFTLILLLCGIGAYSQHSPGVHLPPPDSSSWSTPNLTKSLDSNPSLTSQYLSVRLKTVSLAPDDYQHLKKIMEISQLRNPDQLQKADRSLLFDPASLPAELQPVND